MSGELKYFRANLYKYNSGNPSIVPLQIAANIPVFLPYKNPNISIETGSSAYIMRYGVFNSNYDIFSTAIPDYASFGAFNILQSISNTMAENFPEVRFIQPSDGYSSLIIENAETGVCTKIASTPLAIYPNLSDAIANRNDLIPPSFNISMPLFTLGNLNIFYTVAYESVDENGVPNKFYMLEMTASDSLGGEIITKSSLEIANAQIVLAFQQFFSGVRDVDPPSDDPYSGLNGENEISGDGTGSVSIPSLPPASATATGIIGLFSPTEAQMRALASFMWTDFGGTGSTMEQIAQEIVEALKRSISNPLDYIVGLNIIPSQGLNLGDMSTIRFGYVSSSVSMQRLNSQYFVVDCGSVTFSPICGDTFLDYAPYSKFSIYLPYIGMQELDANDCVGHTIGVIYHGDVVTGGVTAYITKDGSVLYQFSGSCALSIPLTADGWGSTISAAVQIATSAIGAAHKAGAAGVKGVWSSLKKGAANVASNPSQLGPEVQRAGAVSGSAGCMGVQYPYIIREAVRFHSTAYFNTVSGYPSFYFKRFSDLSGYTVILECHLNDVGNATRDEIAEIETLLAGGAEF